MLAGNHQCQNQPPVTLTGGEFFIFWYPGACAGLVLSKWPRTSATTASESPQGMNTSGIPKWGGIHPSTSTSHLVSTLLQTNISFVLDMYFYCWRVFHIAKRHQTAPPWRAKCSSFTTIAIDFDFEGAPQKWKKTYAHIRALSPSSTLVFDGCLMIFAVQGDYSQHLPTTMSPKKPCSASFSSKLHRSWWCNT